MVHQGHAARRLTDPTPAQWARAHEAPSSNSSASLRSGSRRPDVLVLADWYLPAFRAGGPVRSLARMVAELGDEVRFRVLTGDRDLGQAVPFTGIDVDRWITVGKAACRYLRPEARTVRHLRVLLCRTRYDVLYLNSIFSLDFGMKPMALRSMGAIPSSVVVIAPRGELHPGALVHKSWRKRSFLRAAKVLGVYRGVRWHASTFDEEIAVRQWFGRRASVIVARNLTSKEGLAEITQVRSGKADDTLKVAFLSRIAPKKNLHFALDILSGVTSRVAFDVWGPVEDARYWARCKNLVQQLPPNVSVEFKGPVHPSAVGEVLRRYDLFLFPTLGENYGHVVWEALCAGCPVLISDRTPWGAVAASSAGWALSIADTSAFRRVIEQVAAMSPDEHARYVAGARELALRSASDGDVIRANRALFDPPS